MHIEEESKKEYKDSTYLGGFLTFWWWSVDEGVRVVIRLSRSGHSEQ